MLHRYRIKACHITLAVCALLLISCQQVRANDLNEAEPLALRKIMQSLSENMQVITDAISREDWEVVVTVAPLIADHPPPPLGERMRIFRFIGSDVNTFKSYDRETHKAAQLLKQTAARSDGLAVIESFAVLQSSCLACHQRFRKPFVEHFYGQR